MFLNLSSSLLSDTGGTVYQTGIAVAQPTPSHPTPFLTVRVRRDDLTPPLLGICAGYELKEWRCQQLAQHLMQWLPEFALRDSERAAIGAHNAVEMVGKAARAVYASEKYQRRGEPGELLLHVILRQEFGTLPAVCKYFFKDAENDTVKGFDAVHVVADASRLELWLGEVKFYDDIGRAIRDVVKELEDHTQRDYMRSECAAITNKIDGQWPQAGRLKKLLNPNTSLDEIFDAVCIPVLLTYDSPCISGHQSLTASFRAAFEAEVLAHRDNFAGRKLPENVRIHLFLFPLKSKQELMKAFDQRLKHCQGFV